MPLLNLFSTLFLICFPLCKPNGQDLFTLQQQEFDAWMQLILHKYPPGDKIFAVTALIGLKQPLWLNWYDPNAQTWYDVYPGANVAGRPNMKLSLPGVVDLGRLFFPEFPEDIPSQSTGFVCGSHDDFLLLANVAHYLSDAQVLQLFSDSGRLKEYALSGAKYAAASLACLTNICQERIYTTDLQYVLHSCQVVTFCTNRSPFWIYSCIDSPVEVMIEL